MFYQHNLLEMYVKDQHKVMNFWFAQQFFVCVGFFLSLAVITTDITTASVSGYVSYYIKMFVF